MTHKFPEKLHFHQVPSTQHDHAVFSCSESQQVKVGSLPTLAESSRSLELQKIDQILHSFGHFVNTLTPLKHL